MYFIKLVGHQVSVMTTTEIYIDIVVALWLNPGLIVIFVADNTVTAVHPIGCPSSPRRLTVPTWTATTVAETRYP